MPSSIWRITVALLSPVTAQNLATENVTGDNGALGSRGRRGLGSIGEARDPRGREVARLSKLDIDSLLSFAGGHALQSGLGFSGRDGFSDLELP